MGVDLGFAMGLPPKKTIQYFESKGYAFGFRWQDVYAEAHARAFTVAGVMKLDVLEDIRASLTQALKTGESYQTWANQIADTLKRKGWLGGGTITDKETGEISRRVAPHRLETIYRTNMQSAMMAGRYQAQLEAADERLYWEYIAVMDTRTRPSHAAMNGQIFRYDDPIWQTHYPPNGYRCRCRVRTHSARDIERRGYDISDSQGYLQETEQLIDRTGETRPAITYKNPVRGLELTPDPSFSFNAGREYLASLGQHLLERSSVAAPRIACLAVGEVLSEPRVLEAISSQCANLVTKVAQSKRAAGEFMHVGVLPLTVFDALLIRGLAPESSVISISGERILHALRDNKHAPLPLSFWQRLPQHLRTPSAVLLDTTQKKPALLFVYDSPEGKVVVTLDYATKVKGMGDKRDRLITNIVNTGNLLEARNVISLSGYELLAGSL